MVNCKIGDNRLRAGLPKDWRIGDKTGNNGKDAAGDIAIAWPALGGPILIAAYTQGGSPSPDQFTAVFTEIGAVGRREGGLTAHCSVVQPFGHKGDGLAHQAARGFATSCTPSAPSTLRIVSNSGRVFPLSAR